jgi:hypothetical protein
MKEVLRRSIVTKYEEDVENRLDKLDSPCQEWDGEWRRLQGTLTSCSLAGSAMTLEKRKENYMHLKEDYSILLLL